MTISVKPFSGRAGALLLAGTTSAPAKDPPEGQRSGWADDPAAGDITSHIRFGWPASGRIIEGFCWHPGERNDEINIAVAPGTEVHAVEAGRIAYAGDEMRGFHNLILISHADGWVSAYANDDELLVKRGDSVERGQVIARFGDGDQLHFELRHNWVSVDPLLYLGDAALKIAQVMSGQCRG
jgi:murein DD-endopeptidase MepM/ murein hydrolase activator NlpD